MAEINSFPNNSDIYQGAEEVMRWLHGRTKGVYAGEGNAAVSAVPDAMQVSVAPGIGWITDANGDGICWWFDSAITLDIDPAESTGTLNRIDRVILEWKTVDYADLPVVKVLTGTSASTPVVPALTNSSTIRQISLAQVTIPAGTTSLTALNIIDERLDPDVCGIVTETVAADTSIIAAQYDEAIQTLYDAIAQAWSGVISDGAITEAKLAPAVAAKIGVSSVNGKTGAVVIDDIPLPLLWTNASPTSEFAGQTIQLNLSDYDFLLGVFSANSTNSGAIFSQILTTGENLILSTVNASPGLTGYPNMIARTATVSSSQIVFSKGSSKYTNSNSESTTANNRCVPLYIYGIKGVQT